MTEPRKSRSRSRVVVWRDAVRESELDRTAKLVAHTLATYMNARGLAWPSRATLARGGSVSDRAVDAALRRLEADGFLSIERSKGGNPKSCTNRYVAQLPSAANAVRGSEWSAANGTTLSSERHDTSGERRSPEDVEDVEHADAHLGGGVPRVEDECLTCGRRTAHLLIDGDYICADCLDSLTAEVAG